MTDTKTKEPRKVKLNLVGLNGNAFALMGAFQNQASRERWTKEEIDAVIRECKSGDYDHLLRTLIAHTDDTPEDESDSY